MKSLKLSGIVLASMLVIFSACKKDKDDPQPSKTQMLTAKNWKLTSVTMNGADQYGSIPACTKDDLAKYNTDNTVTYDEGATKCDPDDPQTETAVWAFDNNETQLIEDGQTYDIKELSSNTLKLSMTEDFMGQNVELVSTYTAQ